MPFVIPCEDSISICLFIYAGDKIIDNKPIIESPIKILLMKSVLRKTKIFLKNVDIFINSSNFEKNLVNTNKLQITIKASKDVMQINSIKNEKYNFRFLIFELGK